MFDRLGEHDEALNITHEEIGKLWYEHLRAAGGGT